jgi:3-hydroxy-3-methylglutaryl CoA synthase
MNLWNRIKQEYNLEYRAVSETEYCVRCETYMDKYRTKGNTDPDSLKGVFYHCPKCGFIIQAMRPLHTAVPYKHWALADPEVGE